MNPYPSVSDPYYELGVTYEGADYDAIGQTYGVDTRQCLDNNSLSKYTAEQLKSMGWEKYICSGNAWDVHTSRTFAARFRLYVKLKAIPPQGYVSTLGDYIVVQFDGKGGVNALPDAKTSNTTLTGWKTSGYWTAERRSVFTLKIRRSTLAPSAHDIVNQGTRTRTFSVKTSKVQDAQCSDGFKIDSSFYTDSELTASDTALLIGNGLKLRILNGTQPYTFNQYDEYADFTGSVLHFETTYTAELSRAEGKGIDSGPFETVVLFKINYH